MSRTLDIIDLVIELMIDDQRCPCMSRAAWRIKLQPLVSPIDTAFEEERREAQQDLNRETIADP
jgi:hypothetical protein